MLRRLIYKLSKLLHLFNNQQGKDLDSNLKMQIGRATHQPPLTACPMITSAHGQNIGLVRANNEDALFALSGLNSGDLISEAIGIFVVADGMGGHEKGERASAVAVQSIAKSLGSYLFGELLEVVHSSSTEEKLKKLLESALINANIEVKTRVPGGGTTASVLFLIGNTVYIGHVGDSRVYLMEPNRFIQITKDHSLVQKLYDLGEISEEGISDHPRRNILMRALGQDEMLEVDVIRQDILPGSVFLLCTDGLWGSVSDEVIQNIILSNTDNLQKVCELLIKEANQNGGSDNITALIVKYGYEYNEK